MASYPALGLSRRRGLVSRKQSALSMKHEASFRRLPCPARRPTDDFWSDAVGSGRRGHFTNTAPAIPLRSPIDITRLPLTPLGDVRPTA